MTKKQSLLKLIEKRGGRITTKAAREAGYPNSLLLSLADDGVIELESRGVWALSDLPLDDYAIVSMRWPRLVFSRESALYLHDLSDRAPSAYDLTSPRGYRAPAIFEEYPGTKVHSVTHEFFEFGVMEGKSPTGSPIRLYDKERCICDLLLLRRRGKAEVQVFSNALKRYMASEAKNLPKLARYAEKMGVAKELRIYLEVLV